MRCLVSIFLILIIPNLVFATAQEPDVLLYKKERLDLYSNPLVSFFIERGHAPKFDIVRTNCWRGYKATWAIYKGHLYLTDFYATVDKKLFKLSDLFPNSNKSVKTVWYTGTLRIPRGKRLRYYHRGYQSIYEKELRIKIKDGKIIEETMVDNSKSERLIDVQIESSKVVPTTISPGDQVDFVIVLKITDPSVDEKQLSAVISYSFKKPTGRFMTDPVTFECENGKEMTRTLRFRIKAGTKKGKYTITPRLTYKSRTTGAGRKAEFAVE